MRLNQFSYLVAISECGSIIDASRKLFVSQPSVSAAVRELEEELGFEILIRSRRGVEFTPMGEKVLESARTIIKEQERIQSLSQKKAICGNISVGGSSFFFDSVILNTIIKLRERYPDLIITARENDTANLFPMVQNGRLSIGVVLCCHVDKKAYEERIKRYGLNSVEILEDEMVFLTRNNHPLALKGEAPLKEILQYPLALKKSPLHELALALFEKTNANCDVLFLEDYSSLWKSVEVSKRIILSPHIVFQNEKVKDLAAVRISDFQYKYSLYFIHRASPYSPQEKTVVEEMRRQCELMRKSRLNKNIEK